jgi:hypothetical protein
MYIQYRGFKVAENSRIYQFHVLDPAREQREFTVRIQSGTNHWASLKLQDGPAICFERLERELARETEVLRAEENLHISEVEIIDFIKRHYPPVKTYGPKIPTEISADSGAAVEREPARMDGPYAAHDMLDDADRFISRPPGLVGTGHGRG